MKSKLLLLPLASALLLTAFPLQSANAEGPKPATISVSATGRATIAPDMAILNLAVTREGKTARQALTANTKAMTEVLAALKKAGIEDRDLQTSNFNIQPRYTHYPRTKSGPQKPPKITGYVVHNGLTVRIRNLPELGKILDTSVTLGVNSGGGINFTTDNPSAAINEARKNAMARAIEKAKTLTEAAGIGLGRILEISEQNRGQPRPRAMGRMAKSMAMEDSAPVPVARGENSYSVTVNVRWELAQ